MLLSYRAFAIIVGLIVYGSLYPRNTSASVSQSTFWTGERTMFWGHAQQRAMRQGPRKLVIQPKAASFLVNLTEDPGKNKNLAALQAARVQAMARAIADWEKDVA